METEKYMETQGGTSSLIFPKTWTATSTGFHQCHLTNPKPAFKKQIYYALSVDNHWLLWLCLELSDGSALLWANISIQGNHRLCSVATDILICLSDNRAYSAQQFPQVGLQHTESVSQRKLSLSVISNNLNGSLIYWKCSACVLCGKCHRVYFKHKQRENVDTAELRAWEKIILML